MFLDAVRYCSLVDGLQLVDVMVPFFDTIYIIINIPVKSILTYNCTSLAKIIRFVYCIKY